MELFQKAVKLNLTFKTVRGIRTVADIYHLPMKGNEGFNLDEISKVVLKETNKVVQESLIETTEEVSEEAALRLSVLRAILDDRVVDERAAKDQADKAKRKQHLLSLKFDKQTAKAAKKDGKMTIADIDAELAAMEEG